MSNYTSKISTIELCYLILCQRLQYCVLIYFFLFVIPMAGVYVQYDGTGTLCITQGVH
jgi:hypothetical protein